MLAIRFFKPLALILAKFMGTCFIIENDQLHKQINQLVFFASSHQQMLSTTFCKVSKAIFTIGAFKIKQENFYSMERNYITLNFMWSNFFGEKNGCNKMANSLWNQHYMWNKSRKLLQVRKVVRFLIMEHFSFSLLEDELSPLATAQQISHLLFRKSSSTTQILLLLLDTVLLPQFRAIPSGRITGEKYQFIRR